MGAVTPGPGLRPPPPLLGAGPGHARAAADADDVPRDPRAGLVAARRRPRPRDASRWSARLGALEALESGMHRDRRPPRVARTPSRARLDVIADACAEVGVRVVVRLRGHRPPRAPTGARPGLAENERFLRRAAGRGMVGVHAAFTCSRRDARRGGRPGRRPRRRACTSTWPRASIDAERRRPPGAATPTTTGCSSTACTYDHGLPGTIAHNPRSNMNNAVGYARPARFANPVVLGTDGIGADMLEEFRLAYARLREDDVTGHARHRRGRWLEAGWALVPEAARRPGDVELRHRSTRGTWPTPPASGPLEVEVDGEVRAAPTAAPPGSTPTRSGPRPPSRPPASAPDLMSQPIADRRLAAERDGRARAIYLQDAHPIREGMEHRAATPRPAGFDAVWQAESRLVREATVPMAAFAAVTERIKVGSGVVDCWTRNPARLAATFSTLDDLAPAGSSSASAPGGTRWPPRSASTGPGPLDGHARGRRRSCGPCCTTRP